jgi:hypothetical protein
MNSLPNRPIPRGAPESAKTQRARILRVLTDARGAWVALPEMMACAAQYNARIFQLRRPGFTIENRTEADSETGARHCWFRLVSSSARNGAEPQNAAETTATAGDWYEREHGSRPSPLAEHPRAGRGAQGELFEGAGQ